MKITSATIAGAINHRCGQYLDWHMQVKGTDTTVTVKENRFTLVSFFTSPTLFFKAHGARVKQCPQCGQALPRSIEAFKDEEFAG